MKFFFFILFLIYFNFLKKKNRKLNIFNFKNDNNDEEENIINTHTYYDSPIPFEKFPINIDKKNELYNDFQYRVGYNYNKFNPEYVYENPENYDTKIATYVSSSIPTWQKTDYHKIKEEYSLGPNGYRYHKKHHTYSDSKKSKMKVKGYPIKREYNTSVNSPFMNYSYNYNNPYIEHYYLANFNPNKESKKVLNSMLGDKFGFKVSRRLISKK